jgi:hypothetical protein
VRRAVGDVGSERTAHGLNSSKQVQRVGLGAERGLRRGFAWGAVGRNARAGNRILRVRTASGEHREERSAHG